MNRFNLLSTKKLKTALVEQLKTSGINLIEKEFIRIDTAANRNKIIEFIESINKDAYIVFTSSNAVDAVAHHLKAVYLKVFCISGKTREAIEEKLTLAEVVAVAENGVELAKKIIEHDVRNVAFFSGDIRREELPVMLTGAGIKIQELVVYKTTETPEKIDESFSGILFFSPSAVKSFFSVNQLSGTAVCFSIGNTTAEEIRRFVQNRIIIAEKPTQESLVTTINDFYNKVQS